MGEIVSYRQLKLNHLTDIIPRSVEQIVGVDTPRNLYEIANETADQVNLLLQSLIVPLLPDSTTVALNVVTQDAIIHELDQGYALWKGYYTEAIEEGDEVQANFIYETVLVQMGFDPNEPDQPPVYN